MAAFIDEVKIYVQAGDGGKGCESFYRDKYFRYPRPDGGDGGKGGDIVITASGRLHTLLDYRFRQHYKAQRGAHGSSKNKTGRRGDACELRVPVGTIIRNFETGLLIRDLVEEGQSVLVAKGGAGGFGNAQHKNPKPPGQGEQLRLHLELKLIADVGLVGFPNAGKSTLITGISKVKSKIAPYPFTTKAPVLGVVMDEEDEKDFIIADLPGLIEGAHEGRGLGDRFLKHAERTKMLVHLVDAAGSDGRDPVEDYRKINHELRQYNDQLSLKPRLLVANKTDLPASRENIRRLREASSETVFEISALNRDNLQPLVDEIRKELKTVREQPGE